MESSGSIGPEAKYDVVFGAGKVSISVDYSGQDLGASVSLSVPAVKLLQPLVDKLKAAIPGGIDDAILDAVMKEFA